MRAIQPNNSKWSKNFDKRPHRMSCGYWGLNDPFRCMPSLMTAWSLYSVHGSRDSQCFYMGSTIPKNYLLSWGISIPSNKWFLEPMRVSPQTVSRSVHPYCMDHERDQRTDRQTHRPRYSVYSIRPHLAIASMRPNNTTIMFILLLNSNTTARFHRIRLMNADRALGGANPRPRPSQPTLDCESASTVAIYYYYSSRKMTLMHFIVVRRAEGRVDLGTVIRVGSLCQRLHVAVAVVINTTARRRWDSNLGPFTPRSQTCYN